MNWLKHHLHQLLSLYISFVFLQSLFFKFSDSPETVYIFQAKLEPWAAGLGFPGLFAPGGLFNAHVIGSFELLAAVLLLAGSFISAWRVLQALGALLSLGVISGAIFFHLFTPLGVAVVNSDGSSDGGQLFAMACGVWLSALLLLVQHRARLLGLLGRGR